MSKHTPGPWTTDSDGDGKAFAIVTSTHIEDGPDDDVCEVYGGNNDDDATREANARLLSAAPDLLAACKALLEAFPAPRINVVGGFAGNLAHAAARTAIFKAEGNK